jgi:regulator of replication initiation timing
VFGDVHMLSHLVGAANRADIRRLAALDRDNAELHERLDRQQARMQELSEEHRQRVAELEGDLTESRRKASLASAALEAHPWPSVLREELQSLSALVAVQTERRERAEQTAAATVEESERLRAELERLSRHVQVLGGELAAAETQLRERAQGDDARSSGVASLHQALHGRRVLYVGGRPSSMPAIRGLVEQHGGQFQRHDGGLEDRKGLLAAAIGGADLVAFPVDCIDHDSAGNLKRLCGRSGIPFLPLRSASVASFAAALLGSNSEPPTPPVCLKHG